uniref:Uncharacterized protein n=1 Tax=Theileria annulata TaxID=5874 RepID=A0A3B0MXN7_THEAN
MEYEESLEKGVELLESLSLSDSLVDSQIFPLYSEFLNNKLNSDISFDDENSKECVNLQEIETRRQSSTDTINICNNLACDLKIKVLERKITLLETQNSQLIINSCSMYNTLIKHIQSLNDEINKFKSTNL